MGIRLSIAVGITSLEMGSQKLGNLHRFSARYPQDNAKEVAISPSDMPQFNSISSD